MIKQQSPQETLQSLLTLLNQGVLTDYDLFQIRRLTDFITRQRYDTAVESGKFEFLTEGPSVKKDTLANQIESLSTAPAKRRATHLIDAIAALPDHQDRCHLLRLLIVGPRTEVEYFHAISCGFRPENIVCVDLFSYSPYCQPMDAHHFSLPSGSFDVVIHGWVLPYSKNFWVMISEACRVVRGGGLLAIGFNSEAYRLPGVDYLDHYLPEFEALISAQDFFAKMIAISFSSVLTHGPVFPFETFNQRCHAVVRVEKRLRLSASVENALAVTERALTLSLADASKGDRELLLRQIKARCDSVYGIGNFSRVLWRSSGLTGVSEVNDVVVAQDSGLFARSDRVSQQAIYDILAGDTLDAVQELVGHMPLLLALSDYDGAESGFLDSLSQFIAIGGRVVIVTVGGPDVRVWAVFGTAIPQGWISSARFQAPVNFPVALYPRILAASHVIKNVIAD